MKEFLARAVALKRQFDELLGTYWDLAYKEGVERRDHDDEQGLAQATLSGLDDCVKQIVDNERARCAAVLDVSSDEIRLMAGEMTAQEMRTAKAVLAGLKSRIVTPN